MFSLQNTSIILKFIYKLTGIVQFSDSDTEIYQRLWCLPYYLYLIYLVVNYNLVKFKSREVFLFIDTFTNFGNVVTIIIFFISCYRRSNKLKLLVIEVNKIKISDKKTSKRNWRKITLLSLLLVNLCVLPFQQNPMETVFYIYYCPIVFYCFDILFLDDVLTPVLHRFQLINNNLKRQINLVIEESDNSFKLKQIENLSCLHYDLVISALKIVKKFEITITVALAMWFESVIETIYFVIFVLKNGSNNYLMNYLCNGVNLLLCFVWLFILIDILTRVKSEADKTATCIHEIWNKFVICGKIRKIQSLKLTSLQLLNTKLEFTALNFFSLDWSFCHMVILE